MKEDISRTHTEEAMHNNFDKEKAKSKSQSISSPENENTSLIHNNVDDKSQQYNDDEVSSNLYDEDYCELSEDVPRCVRLELLLRRGKKAPDSKDVDNKKDVLKMVKSVNKSTINENVYKSEVETTSQKGKKAKRKGKNHKLCAIITDLHNKNIKLEKTNIDISKELKSLKEDYNTFIEINDAFGTENKELKRKIRASEIDDIESKHLSKKAKSKRSVIQINDDDDKDKDVDDDLMDSKLNVTEESPEEPNEREVRVCLILTIIFDTNFCN
ncbi:hypothetical protein RhiirA1_457140 [Rhizophagus irregularis]|uniref:Uncharacterized protein n=1 Tax=Rhizophagus irregularis TaxID=588596 RepID=A0A2N0RYZ7_9GLOM|nr:hypothetical protein RhiirA1_457140 [Rhizophagus irregularis]